MSGKTFPSIVSFQEFCSFRLFTPRVTCLCLSLFVFVVGVAVAVVVVGGGGGGGVGGLS